MTTEDILSQEEINNLLNMVTSMDLGDNQNSIQEEEQPTGSSKKIKVYNFQRPDRISKEQLRSLHFMHDRFARNFASSLSMYMRTTIDVNLKWVEQISYSEFISSLPDPTFICSIKVKSLSGNIVFEFDPNLVFTIIDKLLGGTGAPVNLNREITEIEGSIMDGVLKLILEDLEKVWNHIQNLKLVIQSRETSAQLIQVIASNEVVVVIVFEIRMGNTSGTFNICIPAILLEPISHRFEKEYQSFYQRPSSIKDVNYLGKLLHEIPVKVEPTIPGGKICIKDLLDLSEGDIIQFKTPVTAPIQINVQNIPKYSGSLVVSKGKRAVKLFHPTNLQESNKTKNTKQIIKNIGEQTS